MTGEPVGVLNWMPASGGTSMIESRHGGTGLDSSSWTGIIRTDAGVWSAEEALRLPGNALLTVEVGDFSWITTQYDNAHHAFAAVLGNTPGESNLSLFTQIPAVSNAIVQDHYSLFANIISSHDSTSQPAMSAIAVWGQASIQDSPKGWAIGVQGYATTVGATDDGLLLSIAAELRNLGTVGSLAGGDQKVNIWVANHQKQVMAAIFMADGHNGVTYGWQDGFLMNDCGYTFISMLEPTGYPFGTPASTTGIVMYNHAKWKSALSAPNDVWIRSNYSSGSINAIPLIKGNADDTTISLGVTRAVASNAANFSPNRLITFKDTQGNQLYIPAMDATW